MNPLVKKFKNYMRNKRDPVTIGRTDEPVGMYSRMILSENISMLTDPRIINRNLNTILFGDDESIIASYIGPNLMQGGRSFVVMDPDGLISGRYARYLEYKGYRVRRLDFIHTDRSSRYNPFSYVSSDREIADLVISAINSMPHGGDEDRPFTKMAENSLLTAVFMYVCYCEKEENRNISFAADLLEREASYLDTHDTAKGGKCTGGSNMCELNTGSPLDEIFTSLEENDPESPAVRQYRIFRIAVGRKLRKEATGSCAKSLRIFTAGEIADIMCADDMDLDRIGDEMTAVFVSAPKECTAFSPVVNMFFTQFFRNMVDYCENRAEFTQIVTDSWGNIIKCFRADKDSIKEAAKEAEGFLKRAKEGKVLFNEAAERYEVVTSHNELVCFRGSKKDALEAFESVKGGKVIGRDCPGWTRTPPVQTMVMLAGFPRLCRIWEFDMLIAILRKWGIIVSIATESLAQLQAAYGDESRWADIIGNCGTVIISGGECDSVTAKFVSKWIISTKTCRRRRKYMAGTPAREIPVPEGCTPDVLQKIPKRERIIAIRGTKPLIDRKYDETSHPEWDTVVRCQNAGFS